MGLGSLSESGKLMIQRYLTSLQKSNQCKIWIIATGNSVNSPVKFKSNFRFPDNALGLDT